MAWGTVSVAQRSVDGVVRKKKKKLGQKGMVSGGNVGDEGEFMARWSSGPHLVQTGVLDVVRSHLLFTFDLHTDV